ncbi:MAG: hypothetical protein J6K39_02850 [Clostridia bacterium]|nr:hypothetical protein [Clostridia bacterium]
MKKIVPWLVIALIVVLSVFLVFFIIFDEDDAEDLTFNYSKDVVLRAVTNKFISENDGTGYDLASSLSIEYLSLDENLLLLTAGENDEFLYRFYLSDKSAFSYEQNVDLALSERIASSDYNQGRDFDYYNKTWGYDGSLESRFLSDYSSKRDVDISELYIFSGNKTQDETDLNLYSSQATFVLVVGDYEKIIIEEAPYIVQVVAGTNSSSTVMTMLSMFHDYGVDDTTGKYVCVKDDDIKSVVLKTSFLI